ncbi:MAG: GNAT family N-acetyltransferase [Gammaproteobacteria bacterium]
MEVKVIHSLSQVNANDWNRLADIDYPFIRHEFLSALERSGSVCPASGWHTRYLLVKDQGRLIAAMPLYEKRHSWGEYVFDQQWAQAYAYRGLNYYPKWLTAIPFTPCLGPRLIAEKGSSKSAILDLLLDFIQDQDQISSWHCLFPEQSLLAELRSRHLIIRQDVQFHWLNRGYRDFDDYLHTLSANKRKMIKRERRRIAEQGIEVLRVPGSEITQAQWQAFYRFYTMTYLKHRNQPYLTESFFHQIAETMPEQCLLILAVTNGTYVGAALSFVGANCLYGRYWGCFEEYNALHFEACYYQGLEYCIARGIGHFDSGAQGEHKIARGFEPILTHSAHWIKDAQFAKAIRDFVKREQPYIQRYQHDATSLLPFKQSSSR